MGESGATFVEYALLVGMIAIALIGILAAFRQKIANFFKGMGTQVENVQNTSVDAPSDPGVTE
jgi:Flp pilus assembly pilin Flp